LRIVSVKIRKERCAIESMTVRVQEQNVRTKSVNVIAKVKSKKENANDTGGGNENMTMERRSLARLAALGISVLLCALGVMWPDSSEELQTMSQPQILSVQAKAPRIKIYVSGAVARPGIYELEAGVRADEAIRAAGGVTQLANLEKVNLAKKLKDGMQVNIPTLSARAQKERNERSKINIEEKKAKVSAGNMERTTERNSGKNLNEDKLKAAATTRNNDGRTNTKKKPVDLNSASAAELESLPGVGPATAQAIIKYRERQSFKTVEDLLKLRGIGPRKLEKLRSLVKV